MYCVNCGVELDDTEKRCPLCETVVYHPDIEQKEVLPLYPVGKKPGIQPKSRAINGIIIILFLIPIFICFLADLQRDGVLNWFGFAAGGIILFYVTLAFPGWFHKPNPVIFLPCDFVAILLYLLYINIVTGGNWFLSFAFPVIGTLCIIVCTTVTLTYYLAGGRLYIFGGGFIALGAFMLLVEYLLKVTFAVKFIGWSIYPLIVLVLLGGVLIYLGINTSARKTMERKLFF